MDNIQTSNPNPNPAGTAQPQQLSQGLEAQLAAALAARPGRNRPERQTTIEVAGDSGQATPSEAPVAPEQPEGNTETLADTSQTVTPTATEPATGVSSEEDVVNFLDFAKDNPRAKIRIPNKNAESGFVELTAEKAAAILGQGSAIHEEQRQFKAREAEFKEYEAKRKQEMDALTIAMELTVAPQLQHAVDEIKKTQGYNVQFEKMLEETQDIAERLKIEANIEQNNRYISEQAELIKTNRPKLDQFKEMRAKQVKEVVDVSRNNFQDKDLKNDFYFNELRDKISKDWKLADQEFIPGVKNIDLISTDEHILSLIRDGLKFREGPKSVTNTGGSIAAATASTRRATATIAKGNDLQERANKGDKVATRDLLSAYLTQQKTARKPQ